MVAVASKGLAQVPDVGQGDLRRSWLSLAAFVPAFVLAFAIGEGLAALLGYPPGGDAVAPWWVMLLASAPALLVFCVPAVAAVHFGRRAARAGVPAAGVPMLVGVVVAGLFVVLNVVQGVVVLLG